VGIWTARVDIAHDAASAEELDGVLDDVMTRLTDYGPAVTWEDLDGGGGCLKVILTFEAGSLRDAFSRALQLVEPAVDERASGVEVLPAAVYVDRMSSASTS
jgi:hypothetical protein